MAKQKVNEAASKSIKTFFKQLNYLFSAFVGSLVLFLISAYVVTAGGSEPFDPTWETYLRFGAPLSGISLMILSYRLFFNRIKTAREADNLHFKMEGYRNANVLRMVILDGAAFINMIGFAMTGNKLYLAICVVVISLFLFSKPTLEKLISDLKLSDLEAKVMRDHAA